MADTFVISPAVLDWVKCAIDISTLPEKQQNQLLKWSEREDEPTFKELVEFSKKAKIPLGYLFLSQAPEEEIELIEFRTVNSSKFQTPSRDFIDTYYEMKTVQDWMMNYMEDAGEDDLPYPGYLKGCSNIGIIVNYIRDLLDLKADEPIKASQSKVFNSLRKKISDLGIMVMQNGVVGANTHRSLELDEFRGFALFDKKAPLIFINAKDSYAGRSFTLLHELVHILLGCSDLYNSFDGSKKHEESIANAVAAELLLPTEVFKEEWTRCYSGNAVNCIAKLSQYLGNSETVIARRALDQGYISQRLYKAVSQRVTEEFKKHKKEKRENGGNYYNTMHSRLDENFISTLAQSVETGETSYMEAFRLTNTNNKTFHKILRDLEFGGRV